MKPNYQQLVAYSLLQELEVGSVKVFYENISKCFSQLSDEKIQLQCLCGNQHEIEQEISKSTDEKFYISSSEIIGISQIILVFDSRILIICFIFPYEANQLDDEIQNGLITLMKVFQDISVNINLFIDIDKKCSDHLIWTYQQENKDQLDLCKLDSQIQYQHTDWKVVQAQNLSQNFLIYRINQFDQEVEEKLKLQFNLIIYEILKKQIFQQQLKLEEIIQCHQEVKQFEQEFYNIIGNLIDEIDSKIINSISNEINRLQQINDSNQQFDHKCFIKDLQHEDFRFYFQNGELDQQNELDQEIQENKTKICQILNYLCDELAQKYLQQLFVNIKQKHRKFQCNQTCFQIKIQEKENYKFEKENQEITFGSEIIQLSENIEIVYYYKFSNNDASGLFILKDNIEYNIIIITKNKIQNTFKFKCQSNLIFWFLENSGSQEENSILYCFNYDNVSVKQLTFDSNFSTQDNIIQIFDKIFDVFICRVQFNYSTNEFYLLDQKDNCFLWDQKQCASNFITQKKEKQDEAFKKNFFIFKENNYLQIYDEQFHFQTKMILSNHNQLILNGDQNLYFFQNIDLLLKGQSTNCILISIQKLQDILVNQDLLFFTEQAFKIYGPESQLSSKVTQKQYVCIKSTFKQQICRSENTFLNCKNQIYEIDFLDETNFPKQFILPQQSLQCFKEIFYSRIPQSLQINENTSMFESIFNDSNVTKIEQYLQAQEEIVKDKSIQIIGIAGNDQNNLNQIFCKITKSRSLTGKKIGLFQFQILKYDQNFYLIIILRAELSKEAHEKLKLLFYLSICDQILIVDNSKIENQLNGLMANLSKVLKAQKVLKLSQIIISFVTFIKSVDLPKYDLNEKKQEVLKDQKNQDIKDAFNLIRFSGVFPIDFNDSTIGEQISSLNSQIFSSNPQDQPNFTLCSFMAIVKSINNNRYKKNQQIPQILELFLNQENELKQLQDRIKQLENKQLNWQDRENRLKQVQIVISDMFQILSRVKQQEENLIQSEANESQCIENIDDFDLEQIMSQIQMIQKLPPQLNENQILQDPLEQFQDQLRSIYIKFNKEIDSIKLSIIEISDEDIQQEQIEIQKAEQQRKLIIQKQKEEEEKIKQKQQLEEQKKQAQITSIKTDLQYLSKQINKQQITKSKVVEEQIKILQNELQEILNDASQSNYTKKYYYARNTQELIKLLFQIGQAEKISIPNMNQVINEQNFELMLYVLKESLLMNQQRELLMLKQSYFGAIDSLIGAFGEDQQCFSLRTNLINYEQMRNDENYREKVCIDFKEKVSQSLKIEFDDIQILGFRQGSTQIDFKIINSKADLIDQNQIQCLESVCGGKIEYYNYFAQAGSYSGISMSDFSPNYNMRWDNFHEKEQRGPQYHRYDYYFPKGCQGFGLNVNIQSYGSNQDWLKMDGNQNEWRIMFHGTKQQYVTAIVKNNLKPGGGQACANYDCVDEFGKQVKVGNGIYFSDNINTCLGYSSPVLVGQKSFVVLFMSRVNPKKIRQSQNMVSMRYFVVNDSKDVRPYRILIKQTN